MPREKTSLLVISDLDGTLLDHDTYSFEAAEPAIEALRKAGVPLVLATSKTLPETLALRSALANEHPCLVENGGAVAVPEGYFPAEALADAEPSGGFRLKRFGPNRETILETLRGLREKRPEFQFQGFGDVPAARVAQWTGLTPSKAMLAQRRCCSEPVVWQGDEATLVKFRKAVSAHGLYTVQGGRFLHVIGPFDKATGLAWLLERFAARDGARPKVVALGDSPNDRDMLRAADTAVVIASGRSDDVDLSGHGDVVRTKKRGPEGWREAIEQILPRYGFR